MASDTTADGSLLQTILSDELAEDLADLASIWADLLLAEMSLHARRELKTASEMFVKRALWEQAVIAYGRCFNTGRRRKLPDRLQAQMAGDSPHVHEEVLRWRNQHVAHRVDETLERTSVTLTYPAGQSVPQSVQVRVELAIGPEDEKLPEAFAELVTQLKNRLWEQEFPKLEEMILRQYGSDAAARARAVVLSEPDPPGTYVLTIDPSGRRSGAQ
jgi:hypothetical protein